MRPAMVPESLIDTRRRLGIDKQDEVWDGVVHMNEPGSFEHQRSEAGLLVALSRVARPLGLTVLPETGVFDPDVPDYKDFRTPDVVVVDPAAATQRGIEGRAALLVEIRCPGDESFEKIPFYGRVGVAELLIIDRDTKDVRRWLSLGGQLDEVPAGPDGWHELHAIPVALRGSAGVLDVRIDRQVEAI
jgi:Uma2 family endonuclease